MSVHEFPSKNIRRRTWIERFTSAYNCIRKPAIRTEDVAMMYPREVIAFEKHDPGELGTAKAAERNATDARNAERHGAIWNRNEAIKQTKAAIALCEEALRGEGDQSGGRFEVMIARLERVLLFLETKA